MVRGSKGAESPFLRQLQSFVAESIGDNGLLVFNSVGDGATDEIIETKTSLKLSEIRSLLNHLHSYGFVEYTREKNMQNGWFTYTWKLNMDRAMQNFIMLKRKEYERLKTTLSREEAMVFYKCRKGCSHIEFELAMEQRFKCVDCKCELKPADNAAEMRKIEQQYAVLGKMMERRSLMDRAVV